MNKPANTTTTLTAEAAAREPDAFEVHEGASDDLVVAEFEAAPLTDVNFGF